MRIDRPNGCASGLLLGHDQLVLTNYHVIQGTRSLAATTDDGTTAELEVLTYDRDRDLALLRAKSTIPEPLPVRWAAEASLPLGESLIVIGYPFPGSRSPRDCSESITVTSGLLSGRLDILGQPMLRTDAALNPGVSGGPALTGDGEIAGIAVGALRPDVAEGVGFLIPARDIEARLTTWLAQLAAGRLEPPAAQFQIAFSSTRAGDFDIYVMNADGTDIRRLIGGPSNEEWPAWSPDGTRIAFISDRDGRDGSVEVFVMNADGTNIRQLTDNPSGAMAPAWSPDGTRIAFSGSRDGDSDIYVMNADGTNVRRLTDDPLPDRDPAWSPDGTRIAFTRGLHIHVMNADGTGIRRLRLIGGPSFESGPVWSPDGTRIAFYGDSSIYVMNADGTSFRQLSGRADFSPAWSPDGAHIAFFSLREGNFDIFVMKADGTNIRQLTDHSAADCCPAWSPAS